MKIEKCGTAVDLLSKILLVDLPSRIRNMLGNCRAYYEGVNNQYEYLRFRNMPRQDFEQFKGVILELSRAFGLNVRASVRNRSIRFTYATAVA